MPVRIGMLQKSGKLLIIPNVAFWGNTSCLIAVIMLVPPSSQLIYGLLIENDELDRLWSKHLGVAIAFCYRSMIQGIIRVSSVAIHGI